MAFSLSTAMAQPNSFDEAAKQQAITMNKRLSFLMKYTEWPKNHTTGDFVIGVYGDEFLYKELYSNHNGKSTGSQTVKVIRYISINEISDCHMLFVAKSKSNYIDQIHKKVDHNKTLIITNKSGLLDTNSNVP